MRATVFGSGWIRLDGLIAVWEILAGLAGLSMTLPGWTRLRLADLPGMAEFGLACLVFSLLCLAGVMLWRDERGGYALSGLLQALQIATLHHGSLCCQFTAGPRAGLILRWPGPSVRPLLDLECRPRLSLFAPAPAERFELNILALLALIVLATAYVQHARWARIIRENLTSLDMNAMYSSRFRQLP